MRGPPAGGAPDVHAASVVALARALRAREISARDLLEAHVARLEAVDPLLNALVADRFDAARREADAADRRLAAGGPDLPPLLGVPCTIKDFYPVGGLPFTAGSPYRRGVVALSDAVTVRRLREAGAVVMGITNVPEGGLWMETYNTVHGRTSNPWDVRHTCGGSSGGEGAVVASGASPFGLGGDIGGSIRLPAAFCGVVGHKPSGGLVPNSGHWPKVGGPAGGNLGTGPLVRRVEDVMPLLRVLAGPDGEDPHARELPLGDPAAVDLGRVTVFRPGARVLARVRPSVRAALGKAADALARRGAAVAELDLDLGRDALSLWAAMLAASDGPGFGELLTGGRGLRLGPEVLRSALGRSVHIAPALAVVALERLLAALPAGLLDRHVRDAEAFRAAVEERLGEGGVLLHPPYPTPAPRHRAPLLRPLGFLLTAAFNVLRMPVTQVPVGFDARGLPLGVQVAARHGADHLAVAAAGAVEEAFGGWVMADPVPA